MESSSKGSFHRPPLVKHITPNLPENYEPQELKAVRSFLLDIYKPPERYLDHM
ncbi:hypothetical protein GYMLUDRAFT_907928 [Collybiopsis luxurians FD-317 M1]|nr:hypothetical protein GYMLUDRAFT_907928 [Collybiopsis luxurians FD-317 M1]